MLQIAPYGYKITGGTPVYYSAPYNWYEPGFNFLWPLEFSFQSQTPTAPPADVEMPSDTNAPFIEEVYFMVRKRSDTTGTNFTSLVAEDMTATAADITTGNELSVTKRMVTWMSLGYNPVQLTINRGTGMAGARVSECTVSFQTYFLYFRVLVDSLDRGFYYMAVDLSAIEKRPTMSAYVNTSMVDLTQYQQLYLLLSPYAYIIEDTEANASFSYPTQSVFYRRQQTSNDEDFDFSIHSVSPSLVADNVSLFNVPYYEKVAVLNVDKNLQTALGAGTRTSFVTIKSVGRYSLMEDNIRIMFST